MSKHDLKGMDLGKVGANKDVDFTFKEYMDSFGGRGKKIPKMTKIINIDKFLSKKLKMWPVIGLKFYHTKKIII